MDMNLDSTGTGKGCGIGNDPGMENNEKNSEIQPWAVEDGVSEMKTGKLSMDYTEMEIKSLKGSFKKNSSGLIWSDVVNKYVDLFWFMLRPDQLCRLLRVQQMYISPQLITILDHLYKTGIDMPDWVEKSGNDWKAVLDDKGVVFPAVRQQMQQQVAALELKRKDTADALVRKLDSGNVDDGKKPAEAVLTQPGGKKETVVETGLRKDEVQEVDLSTHSGDAKSDEMASWKKLKELTVKFQLDPRGKPYYREEFIPHLTKANVKQNDIEAFGHLRRNNEWHLTLKTEEARNKVLAMQSMEIRGSRCRITSLTTKIAHVRVHWLPYYFPNERMVKYLSQYGEVAEAVFEPTTSPGFSGTSSLVRGFVMKMDANAELPYQDKMVFDEEDMDFLITVNGRRPKCFRCGIVGHAVRKCETPYCKQCGKYGHSDKECTQANTYATRVRKSGKEIVEPEVIEGDIDSHVEPHRREEKVKVVKVSPVEPHWSKSDQSKLGTRSHVDSSRSSKVMPEEKRIETQIQSHVDSNRSDRDQREQLAQRRVRQKQFDSHRRVDDSEMGSEDDNSSVNSFERMEGSRKKKQRKSETMLEMVEKDDYMYPVSPMEDNT